MIDATWPRPGITRHDYLLACARAGRRKSKPDGWATGVIDCVTLERDFNSVAVDDDSINYRSDQFADICTPRSARHVGNLMVAALLAA